MGPFAWEHMRPEPGAFILDTAGAIGVPGQTLYFWADHDAFTQGFLAAFLESIRAAYSDLAAETLAALLKDCAAYQSRPENYGAAGMDFCLHRQRGNLTDFPPLTATRADDGKVYLKEADA